MTGAKNIHAQIEAILNYWNNGAFDDLIYDYYTADTGVLGERLREPKCGATSSFIFEPFSTQKIVRGSQTCLQTGTRRSDATQWTGIKKTGIMDETVTLVLAGKHPP